MNTTLICLTLAHALTLIAATSLAAPKSKMVPTHADLHYGPDEKQTMDVWLARSDSPTPCIVYIHGGGWLQGDKSRASFHKNGPRRYLREGISVFAINYRFLKQTTVDSGSTRGTGPILPRGDYPEPPVAVPLHDAARAIQYIRSRADEWNLDTKRIGLTGGSAGACTSLWLAFHDDMADPDSEDPIARQSTKPYCAAVNGAQTSLDPAQCLEWTPNSTYGGHAFGYIWDHSDHTVEIRSFLKDRTNIVSWIEEYSPYCLATADDPPVYLEYGDIPERGKEKKNPVHTSNYGALLVEKLDTLGVEYEFNHKGVTNPRFKNITEYLLYMLKK